MKRKAFQGSLPFSPNLFLAVRMMKHKGVKSKETTEISTQTHFKLDWKACCQYLGYPEMRKVISRTPHSPPGFL